MYVKKEVLDRTVEPIRISTFLLKWPVVCAIFDRSLGGRRRSMSTEMTVV
jgi:hypothetical protein